MNKFNGSQCVISTMNNMLSLNQLSTQTLCKWFPRLVDGTQKKSRMLGISMFPCQKQNQLVWGWVDLKRSVPSCKKHKMFWAPCDTDTRCDLSCKKNKLDLLIVKSFVSSDVQKTASLLQKAYFYFYVHLIVGVGHSQGSMDNLVPGSLCQFNSIQPSQNLYDALSFMDEEFLYWCLKNVLWNTYHKIDLIHIMIWNLPNNARIGVTILPMDNSAHPCFKQ